MSRPPISARHSTRIHPDPPSSRAFLSRPPVIKKAVSVRTHLNQFRKDKDAKFRLILIESRIHRLARYYKSRQVISPTFKYESATASALVA